MAAATTTASAPAVVLVSGEDEFAVKQRARALYQQWCQELGGMDHEIIDASVGNSGEALKAVAKLREALQTLPFFGGGKAVWLQNCSFLGDDRTATSAAVTEALGELAQEFKGFPWGNVRLLVSAGKVDKRKVFYKTMEKLGAVESFAGLSADDRDWAGKAEETVLRQLRAGKKDISDAALAKFVSYVGPNSRQLVSEAEKVSIYVGERSEIETKDVDAVVIRNKQAKAFALGDALGDRDLPRTLRCLDEALWETRLGSQKSEIGLLYGLITKVRALLFLKEMLQAGWIRADGDYNRFKAQLERIPVEQLPVDKRINPLSMNPYVLFKALPQAGNYSSGELVQAMGLLLEANRRLVQTQTDESVVLQQVLVQILKRADAPAGAASRREPRSR
jgi:DNA polymerase III subunit delta